MLKARSHLFVRLALYNCLIYILNLLLFLAWMLRVSPLHCYCPLKLIRIWWSLINKLLFKHITVARTQFPVSMCVHVDKHVQNYRKSCSFHAVTIYVIATSLNKDHRGTDVALINYCAGGWDHQMCKISSRCISIKNIFGLRTVVLCACELTLSVFAEFCVETAVRKVKVTLGVNNSTWQTGTRRKFINAVTETLEFIGNVCFRLKLTTRRQTLLTLWRYKMYSSVETVQQILRLSTGIQIVRCCYESQSLSLTLYPAI